MKKQLLIAAVAASMTSVAMADVSITGEYEGTVSQSTGAASFAQDLDLTVVGTSGSSSVTMTLEDITGGTDIAASQVFLKTDLEGVSFKAGKYESTNGNGILAAATNKDRIGLSTTVAGFGVGLTNASGDANGSVTVSGTIAGASVKVQNILNSSRYITIGTSVAGVKVDVETTKGAQRNTAIQLSGDVAGVAVVYANIDFNGDATEDRSTARWGNIAKVGTVAVQKTTALSLTMPTALGSVNYKRVDNDGAKTNQFALTRGNVVYKSTKTDGADRTLSAKVKFKF
jgi:hypothetical protein